MAFEILLLDSRRFGKSLLSGPIRRTRLVGTSLAPDLGKPSVISPQKEVLFYSSVFLGNGISKPQSMLGMRLPVSSRIQSRPFGGRSWETQVPVIDL